MISSHKDCIFVLYVMAGKNTYPRIIARIPVVISIIQPFYDVSYKINCEM